MAVQNLKHQLLPIQMSYWQETCTFELRENELLQERPSTCSFGGDTILGMEFRLEQTQLQTLRQILLAVREEVAKSPNVTNNFVRTSSVL